MGTLGGGEKESACRSLCAYGEKDIKEREREMYSNKNKNERRTKKKKSTIPKTLRTSIIRQSRINANPRPCNDEDSAGALDHRCGLIEGIFEEVWTGG